MIHLVLFILVPLSTGIDNGCLDNPCENAGTCESMYDGVVCHCKDGYYGNACENVGYAYSYTRLISVDKTLVTSIGEMVTKAPLEMDIKFETSYSTPLVIQNTQGNHGSSECDCMCTRYGNTSEEEVDSKVLIDKIEDELLLDKDKLIQAILKHKSLEDDRPSAKGIGSAGCVIIVFSILVIMVPDVLSVIKYVYISFRKIRPAST